MVAANQYLLVLLHDSSDDGRITASRDTRSLTQPLGYVRSLSDGHINNPAVGSACPNDVSPYATLYRKLNGQQSHGREPVYGFHAAYACREYNDRHL